MLKQGEYYGSPNDNRQRRLPALLKNGDIPAMSGIGGILNLDGRPVDPARLDRMADAMAYRSPDDAVCWTDQAVGFVHRPLHTTPESLHEHQPFVLNDGAYLITGDVRIDNRQALIEALQASAPVDAETPDAELLLRAYLAWDEACLQRVVGDFAVAIWDAPRRRLLCARDPMGIRTLYYYRDATRFLFASDVQALLATTLVPRTLNPLMVALYLMGKTTEAEHTFFQDIFQLPPAHRLTVGPDDFNTTSYWEPDPWSPIHYPRKEAYLERFRELFFEAVRCRLRSITPVGMTLSGGMDSSSVTCTAAHLLDTGRTPPIDLHTFSSVFGAFPDVDESDLIRTILNNVKAQAHYIQADGLWGFKPLRDPHIRWNRPYPVPFAARHEVLLNRAREAGLRVLYTGEGGDELLNPGYGYLLDMMKRFQLPALRQELRFLAPVSRRELYKMAFLGIVPTPIKRVYGRLRAGKVPGWINDDFIASTGALEHLAAAKPRRRSASIYADSVHAGLLNFPKQPFLPYITEMYAHHHLEPRHPFLDMRLIEFLSRIPPQLKFFEGWTKWLLREAMEDILPDEVRLRAHKSTFSDVFHQGLHEERRRIESFIKDGHLVQRGWVKQQEMTTLYQGALGGDHTLAVRMLSFISLEDWIAEHFGAASSDTVPRPSEEHG